MKTTIINLALLFSGIILLSYANAQSSIWASSENIDNVKMSEEFYRINRLPPYIFNIVNELKVIARKNGDDIIDFGMGNPDQKTPEHIINKMKECSEI